MAYESVHVVCFGNELHADDGFGPAVHSLLQGLTLPKHVHLFRADISGLSAINCFDNCRHAIVVDALRGYGPAGSLHHLETSQAAVEAAPGSHGAGVGSLLKLLPLTLAQPPSISLLGAEVAHIESFSPGLSEAVADAVPRAGALLMEQLSHV